jgi:hypothetical protein
MSIVKNIYNKNYFLLKFNNQYKMISCLFYGGLYGNKSCDLFNYGDIANMTSRQQLLSSNFANIAHTIIE